MMNVFIYISVWNFVPYALLRYGNYLSYLCCHGNSIDLDSSHYQRMTVSSWPWHYETRMCDPVCFHFIWWQFLVSFICPRISTFSSEPFVGETKITWSFAHAQCDIYNKIEGYLFIICFRMVFLGYSVELNMTTCYLKHA